MKNVSKAVYDEPIFWKVFRRSHCKLFLEHEKRFDIMHSKIKVNGAKTSDMQKYVSVPTIQSFQKSSNFK